MSMIFKKMIELKKAIDHIKKDQVNKGQGFKFRGIDQIYNEIHSKAAAVGIFTVPHVLESTVQERTSKSGSIMLHVVLKIKYTFYAEDGSNIESIVYGEALDSGDKAYNKCLSIAHKYCLLQSFMIPTEECDDPDYESHEIVKNETPVRRVEQVKKNEQVKNEQVNNERSLFLKRLGLAFKNNDDKKLWLTERKIMSNDDINNLNDDDLIGLNQELKDLILLNN